MQRCRDAENGFNAEDAEERRDAEDSSREESPSRNAPGFFWGTAAREAARGFPSGRPKKEPRLVAGRPVSVCRSLRLCPSAFSALKQLPAS
jgi:hypothetical protein